MRVITLQTFTLLHAYPSLHNDVLARFFKVNTSEREGGGEKRGKREKRGERRKEKREERGKERERKER